MKPSNTTVAIIELTNDANLDDDDNDGLGTKEIEDREENLFTLDKIKKTLKPLYFSLRCFGLAYDETFQAPSAKFNSIEPGNDSSYSNDIEAQGQMDSRRQPKQSLKCNPGKYYCIFISVLLWSQVIVSSINFSHGHVKKFLDIMQTTVPFAWMMLCASQQIVFFRATFTKNNKLSKFGKFLKELVLVKADDMSSTAYQIKVIVLVTWITYTTNTVMIVFALTYSSDQSGRNEFREILLGKWDAKRLAIITYIYLPTNMIFTGVWLFSTASYVAMCVLVAKRFDDVFKRASSAITFSKNVNFAALRKEHVQLCHVVSALDDILSPSGLVSYAINIPMTCLTLNICIITFDEASTAKRMAYIFWVTSDVAILFLISVAGALLNHKAYSLSEVIYDINANDLDSKSELELLLLVSNLNSNSTGLTVGGLTTITKGMIITVFGTVIGYFTILIQFQA